MQIIKRFLVDERGVTSVEYGVIVIFLSLVIVASIGMVGNEIEDLMSNPARTLQNKLD